MSTIDEDVEVGKALQARIKRQLGPELIELLLKASAEDASESKDWPPERMFQYLRCRLRFTQSELAGKAGLTQSQVSRLESGADCLLSTWLRAYAAMGFRLRLTPASAASLEELEKTSEIGRPDGYWIRQRARPRRLWRNGVMLSRAEWNLAREGRLSVPSIAGPDKEEPAPGRPARVSAKV